MAKNEETKRYNDSNDIDKHGKQAPATILNLYRILSEMTDADHGLKGQEIMERLRDQGTPLGRTAFYEYIEALDTYLFKGADEERFEYGGCIVRPGQGNRGGYRLMVRKFSLPEIKILTDAVAASRSISKETAYKLTEKLESLVSKEQAKMLRSQVCVDDRIRPAEEFVFKNISEIIQAIDGVQDEKKIKDKYSCKVKFDYYEYSANQKLNKIGEYICSPYALAWINDEYCLIASDPDHGIMAYRVDRMGLVEKLIKEKADSLPADYTLSECEINNGRKEQVLRFDLSRYLSSAHSVFGGENDENVALEVDKSVMSSILEKVGYDARIIPTKDNNKVSINVKVDPEHPENFFAWFSCFGTKVRIVNSTGLKEKYREYLQGIIKANG